MECLASVLIETQYLQMSYACTFFLDREPEKKLGIQALDSEGNFIKEGVEEGNPLILFIKAQNDQGHPSATQV